MGWIKINSEQLSLKFPVKETAKKRTSIRTYKPKTVSKELENNLKEYSEEIKGPFSSSVRFVFITDDNLIEKNKGKIGTYGVIKGAKNFILALIEKQGNKNLEQLGYKLELLILYATYLNLGTCWLGGTFNLKGIEKSKLKSDNEMLPVISPVGYPGEKKSLIDKAMKIASGSKKRKSWSDLFFNKSFNTSINESEAEFYVNPLEMVRLAPSASNNQPWRIVKDDKEWHFFLKYSNMINKAVGFDIQRIDMGIAMSHFEMTALEEGLSGEWIINESKPKLDGAENMQYIVSWKEKS